jgi:Tol biopolymer transport system component
MTRHLPVRRAALATLAIVVLALLAHVQAQKPASQAELLLGRALNLEDVAGNLKDAIATYEQVLKAPDATRAQKARAQFRIGACYERLGADGARRAYEAVVANYGDVPDFAAQAKSRLAAMGSGAAESSQGSPGPTTRMLWGKVNWQAARLSPDGKAVAFIDMARANLWVRDIATGVDRNLTNTPKERSWTDFPLSLSWSHDGTRLAYDWFADGGATTEIRVVDVRTGAISTFETTRAVNTGRSDSAALTSPEDWSPDDTRILVTIGFATGQCRLAWLSVKDGTVTELKGIRGAGLDRATVSPDGAWIAYALRGTGPGSNWDVYIAPADGMSATLLIGGPTNDAPVGWTPDGSGLVYKGSRSGTEGLWVARLSKGKTTGDPELVPGVGRIDAQGVSRSGALLYATGGQRTDLWVATVDLAAGRTLGKTALEVPAGSAAFWMGSYSPDGSVMTYDVKVGNRTALAVARADGTQPRLFTPSFEPASTVPLAWAADSRTVFRPGTFDTSLQTIFRVDAQTGASEPLFPGLTADYRAPGDQISIMIGVSADARTAYYQKNNRETRRASLWSLDVATGREKELFRADKPAGIFPGGLSPDGTRLLFLLNPFDDAGPKELRVLSIADGTMSTLCKPSDAVMTSAWSPDARHVVFTMRGEDSARKLSLQLWVVDASGGQPQPLGLAHPIIRGVAVHPDGGHIAYVSATPPDQEEWLLENFLPPAKAPVAKTQPAAKR